MWRETVMVQCEAGMYVCMYVITLFACVEREHEDKPQN